MGRNGSRWEMGEELRENVEKKKKEEKKSERLRLYGSVHLLLLR